MKKPDMEGLSAFSFAPASLLSYGQGFDRKRCGRLQGWVLVLLLLLMWYCKHLHTNKIVLFRAEGESL